MNRLHVKYLCAGGGVASSAAVVAIRGLDAEGPITLVGQEINRPYSRLPLSGAFLRRQARHDDLFTLDAGWFARNHIDLRTGTRVVRIDCARNSAALDNGQEISYDNLLLAVGASPRPLRIPGAELPNVFSLRSIEDAERLQHAIDQAKSQGRQHSRGRGRVTIIGAGSLGLELAGSLTQLGLSVDFLCKGPWPWHRYAGESTGKFLARYLEGRDIRVHREQTPLRLEGDGRVQRVVLTDQTIDCDFVVVSIGVVPNKEILRNTPITAEKAILTDAHCRTSVRNVFAAGDCAAIFDPLFGKHRILDHYESAVITGQLAGANMAGDHLAYNTVNTFTMETLDITLQSWGEPKAVSHRLLRGTPSADHPAFTEFGIASDNRIAQVLSIRPTTSPAADEALRQLVARRTSAIGIEEQLKDPQTDLGPLLARS
jgi:NADPH-dependent 2,4-dienoyl-CoA reductase/sulfur reductase-like enzyme